MRKISLILIFVFFSLSTQAFLFKASSSDSNGAEKAQQQEENTLENIDFNFKRAKHLKSFRDFDINGYDPGVLRNIKKNKHAVTAGKGIWVNLWNYPLDLKAFVDRLDEFDIDTVYLQVNRSTTEVFKHQDKIDEILKACHEEDIKVIGWSYAYLIDVKSDANKFIRPALYVSPDGESFDAFAADIEENTKPAAVEAYTDLIKSSLPEKYPMIAIVFSPKIKSVYPWKYIANNWDILMPMVYWHGLKKRNLQTVADFVSASINNLRELTGKQDLNIHMITDGERTTPHEVAVSLEVARKLKVNSGVSVYPEHLVSDTILEVLKDFKV
ncbi:MAG: hypothetical protein MK033_05775 [Candidatus Caenarcaniphilales bacterium]|nr:hypothetical protein [Candidatus Caenarcaniphilales bacterium]